MTPILPARPSLVHLRREARALRRACRAGEPEARAQLACVFPGIAAASLALSKAQAVVARQYGFPNWPALKAHIDALIAPDQVSPRPDGDADTLAALWFGLAEAGDLTALNRALAVGKGRMTAARELMRRAPRRYQTFVRALIDGLAAPAARTRFECAHGLDTFGDDQCRPHIVPLMDDPVPKVRWMAMHALSCHACGEKPDALEEPVRARIIGAALSDPSIQVRRHAVVALGLAGARSAEDLLRGLAASETDVKLRRNAEWALRRVREPG